MAGETDKAAEPAVTVAKDYSALCTACGLCCDGSLFKAVTVKSDEIAAVRQLGLVVEQGADAAAAASFRQPCPKLVDRSCSIYAQRPATCRAFACALLKRTHKGEMTLDEAQNVVAAARDLRDKIAAAIPDDTGVAAWLSAEPDKDWMQIADPDTRRSAARRHLDQVVLLKYLTTHFWSGKEKPGGDGGKG